jgi:2-phospho-L-lactate guanylyltransferase
VPQHTKITVPMVIPFKTPKSAKGRLAGALNTRQREALSLAMLDDVLEIVCACPDIQGVWLLTDEPQIAVTRAVECIVDKAGTLNGAVEQAAEHLQEQGSEHMCVLHADLPLLKVQALSDMVEAHRQLCASHHEHACVSIATDTRQDGSNGMLCSPPTAIPFAYGPGSMRAHLRNAEHAGAKAQTLEISSLAMDIDSTVDFEHLKKALAQTDTGAQYTRQFLSQLRN